MKLLTLLLVLSANCLAYDIEATLVRVYDGDTFFVNIDGIPDVFGKSIGVRVRGIDAPEIRGGCRFERTKALEAKMVAALFLSKGRGVVSLRNVERGKYFRLLADVYVNGESLANYLVVRGYADFYDGGTKQSWCG